MYAVYHHAIIGVVQCAELFRSIHTRLLRNLLCPQVTCVFGWVQKTSGGLTGSFHILTELSWEGTRQIIALRKHCASYNVFSQTLRLIVVYIIL